MKKDKYSEQAKENWGSSSEYKEFEEKHLTDEDLNERGKGIINILIEFGKVIDNKEEGIKLVKTLQDYISENFYQCSNEVLLGLGEMYVNDIEMSKNIDLASGVRTSKFVNECIKEYVK